MSATATTRQGRIEGFEEPGLLVFKGIPYAAPPTGKRRWMAPEKPASWNGVRPAKQFAHAAPQPTMPAGGVLAALVVTDPQDEDCLSLNVWTPSTRGSRPVLVWIHGGAFEIGAGSQAIYDGANLARRGDVVLVTINYRLGPFGFLRLVDLTNGRIQSTGNEGLLDQIAALEWVRDNISEFGGDPENVTIFGESAGGMSCGALLGMPAARGLFHKAIPQSGACHTAMPAATASEVAARVIRKAGVGADADRLLSLSSEQIISASPNMMMPDPEDDGRPFLPVFEDAHLPRLAIDAVKDGASASVAVLVGSTREEWKLFSIMDPGAMSLDDDGLTKRLGRRLESAAIERITAAYRGSRASRGEPVAAPDLYSAVETDRMFGIPALRLAQAQCAHDPRVYRYLFTWKSPAMGGILGACHGLEIGFVFGTMHVPGMSEFCGTGPTAEALAHGMQAAWIAFARDGDPSCENVGEWPAFDAKSAKTMLLGVRPSVQSAPFEDEARAWEGIPERSLGR